jgi:hypothetical protein
MTSPLPIASSTAAYTLSVSGVLRFWSNTGTGFVLRAAWICG